MKFSVAASILALTALSTAAPTTKSGPLTKRVDGVDVFDSVQTWLNDVVQVNSFLDAAVNEQLSGDALVTAATTAQGFALDEPTQLKLQAALPGLSQDGIDAANDLMAVFQTGVLDQLQIIIDNADDEPTVAAAIGTINQVRCVNVLPDVDVLWPAALTAVSTGPLPDPAPREAACILINGTK